MNSKIESILNREGIFSIVAKDEDFPHIIGTWNTFVIFKDNNLFVPVGGIGEMEEILERDNRVIVVIGTRGLIGLHGPGIEIKIIGKAIISQDIKECEIIKDKYEWARAVMKIEIMEAYQTT